TGVMSSYLANKGHALTLTDISADILSMAEVPSSVVTYQADLQSIQNLADFDIVLCHAVLEWLADPKAALAHMAENMRPGSWLSLTFFNKDAALFGNAVYGNFDYIARGMKVKKQVRLNPKQPLSVAQVTEWVEELGFEIAASRGIRCFHDYLRDPKKASEDYESLLALERQYNQQAPFKWLGKYFHLWL
ncbi:MAG: methyltransferase domain-containing protein, partial [Alteromonas sp.]|nr:methyltransferase domain-containing protein [Alteromonas sp.]